MRPRSLAAAVPVVLLVLALQAPAAQAASVFPEAPPCPPQAQECPVTLVFAADPGEANRVTVHRDLDGSIVFHDAGAPVTGCLPVDPSTVRCEPTGLIALRLGDGNDQATAEGPLPVTMDGGPGDDVLRGGDGADTLEGGEGDDTLVGGAGDDVLIGGPGADDLDGGDGADAASWAERTNGVTADLAAGTGGDGGAEDRLRNIEILIGGSGADVLAGGPGDDTLVGGAGDDHLYGRDGNDLLEGGAGSDRLSGGAGADDLDAGASRLSRPSVSERDAASCGKGRDLVEDVLIGGTVTGDCELVSPEGVDTDLVLRLNAAPRPLSSAVVKVATFACNAPAPGRPCRTRLRVRGGDDAMLGEQRLVLGNLRSGAGARLVLNDRGRSRLQQRRLLHVRIELRGDGCDYDVCGFRTTLRSR